MTHHDSTPQESGITNTDIAVRVKDLTKTFKVYNRPVDLAMDLVFGKERYTPFTALKDVSFELKRGEVFGIVGRNGSGKSTLLKILADKLDKTSGQTETNGKVSAILELGTGFHPEFTGRENIVVGGMCMGMTKEEIAEKEDWIIQFSELEKFIDMPFKTYSSGMQARLTFSLAVSMQPDIFLIDEALATGDTFFVNKCLRRIEDICNSGSTVIMVSHSLNIFERLCHRCMWLKDGRIEAIGTPSDIIKQYETHMFMEQVERERAAKNTRVDVDERHFQEAAIDFLMQRENIKDVEVAGAKRIDKENPIHFQSDIITMTRFETVGEDGKPKFSFIQGEDITFRIHYSCGHIEAEERIVPSLAIYRDGTMVTGSVMSDGGHDYVSISGEGFFECKFPKNIYGAGNYVVSAGFIRDTMSNSGNDFCSFYWKSFSFSVKRKKQRPYNYFFEQDNIWTVNND